MPIFSNDVRSFDDPQLSTAHWSSERARLKSKVCPAHLCCFFLIFSSILNLFSNKHHLLNQRCSCCSRQTRLLLGSQVCLIWHCVFSFQVRCIFQRVFSPEEAVPIDRRPLLLLFSIRYSIFFLTLSFLISSLHHLNLIEVYCKRNNLYTILFIKIYHSIELRN